MSHRAIQLIIWLKLRRIMEEWGIRLKVTCLVTDKASNMLACGRELHLKQAGCIAHVINLMVKKFLG